eukprot:jgi/Chrzof1/10003/Cz04g23190.t1
MAIRPSAMAHLTMMGNKETFSDQSSSVSKATKNTKKQERLEEQDVLQHFPAFRQFHRSINGTISYFTADTLTPTLHDWCYQLCVNNMKELYLPVWGWKEKDKRKQFKEEESRFLVVYENGQSDKPLAYVNFRFELEDDVPVIYCYELQLEQAAQRQGLGKFLMQLLELIGLKYGMQGVMLTVMSGNMAAREFYSKLGYRVHNTSPGYDDATEAAGYEILHKPFRRRQPVSESTGKENNGH